MLFFDCTTWYFESFKDDRRLCCGKRMLNEANLAAIAAAGAYDIVVAKLKQLPKAQQTDVLNKSA